MCPNMNFKALSLAAAVLSASLFSASAFAAPLVCKKGEALVTVKSVAPMKTNVVVVTFVVNASKEERGLPYTLNELKVKKIKAVVGAQSCIEESDVL